jgi:hypothetical protein
MSPKEEEEQKGAAMEEEEKGVMPCLEPRIPLVDAVQALRRWLQRGHDARHLIHLLGAHRRAGQIKLATSCDEIELKKQRY